MKKSIRLALAIAACLLLLPLAGHAQAKLKLKDGSRITGHATRYDGDAEKLYFTTDDGRDLVLGLDELAVHLDLVPTRVGFRAEFGRDLAVHAYASSGDQVFGATSRGKACARNDLL